MDRPTRPPDILSLDMTANKAQNKTIKPPSTSRDILNHLKKVQLSLVMLQNSVIIESSSHRIWYFWTKNPLPYAVYYGAVPKMCELQL